MGILTRVFGGEGLPQRNIRVLGVDLGTTNCAVTEVHWHPGERGLPDARSMEVEQPTRQGTYTHVLVPSVVAIHEGTTLVGEGAKRLRADAPSFGLERGRNLFFDCKNDIGTRRTYHRAVTGYRSATEIAAHVLRFLTDAALADGQVDRVVVTVPASFQVAQRQATLDAAQAAGLDLHDGGLLDEPIAAFLDYVLTHGGELPVRRQKSTGHLLVFDFGGGTCDVAVLRLTSTGRTPLKVAPLAVSRYHRLGGGDIDAAIVHDVLLPQLIAQNALGRFDLGFRDKKQILEPAFIGVAESLKIKLCVEVSRLQQFGKWQTADKALVGVSHAGVHTCVLGDRELTLESATLTASQFEEVLGPFLDHDLLYARETEYGLTCSVFAPIQDALDRAGLLPRDVDYYLLVGGSSLIPQVRDAVTDYFTEADVLAYDDEDSLQTAVARGAAYHALAIEVLGGPPIQPVSQDDLSIRAQDDLIRLVPQGEPLPYPADERFADTTRLLVPEDVHQQPLDLRVELVAGDEGRLIYSGIWQLLPSVSKGAPLLLRYRFTENQVFEFSLSVDGDPDVPSFEARIEHPLTNVLNPNEARLEIDELEEKLRRGEVPSRRVASVLEELADKYADLHQDEKALEYLRSALQAHGGAEPQLINKMAMRCDALGDDERAERLYREAGSLGIWGGPWFNLALSQRRRGKLSEALESIDQALSSEREPPYLVLRARILQDMGNQAERDRCLCEAFEEFDQPERSSEWALGWFLTAAEMDGRTAEVARARQLLLARGGERVEGAGGVLPAVSRDSEDNE